MTGTASASASAAAALGGVDIVVHLLRRAAACYRTIRANLIARPQLPFTRLVDIVALPVGPVLAKLAAEDGDAHWVPGPAPTRGPQRPVRTWRGSDVDPFRAVWRADRR